MFLRAIEMQGFKSFADKTRVEFDPGVTAVVGPNGSGKSNITESLRWALGESSAKSLRGGKMPDVIFAGTENRKPLNYAQVVVTLDNGDGFIPDRDSEIRIERHIYRNGDSDYLIDGKKVRLKDIHDLFMDTGLGRDSFSIISQGRVESIFNSKPEERRAIFEEAAGVLKYKTRKKETQQKLDQTQGNLDRLEDIIHELTSQVGPLAKQAETAQRFQVLDKEREQLQLDILVADIDVDKTNQARLEEELTQVKADLSAYYQRKDQLEEENQALKTRRHQLTDNLSASQEDLVRLTRLVADLERQIEVYHLEENQAAERAALKNQRLAELADQAENLRSAIAQAETKREELAAELATTQDKIASLERDLERYGASPDQVMEALREDFVKLVQEEASVSNRLTAIQGELDQQAERSANQSAQRQQVAKDLSYWQEETQAALAKFETSQAQVRDLLAVYQSQAQALQDLSQSYQTAQSALFDQLDQLKHKEARQTSLQSILKNHSNFYAGVKSVLQSSQQLGGIVGAVSEHLTFDQTYQTALEVALGASSQHVIVADEAAAKRAIAFLKQNRQGRATFLPLTTIKPRQLRPDQLDKLTASPGFLGLASDLVSYEPSLGNIFQNLLGMTAIFAELDQANQAARQLHYQVRLVTLDGTELRPGGAFAGGANRQNQTTFIKPELDALNQEIAQLRSDLTRQEDQVKSLKEARERAEADLETIKSQGEAARLTEQKADLEYQQADQRLADTQRLHDQLGQAEASQADQELLEEQGQLTKRLTAIASQKADLSDQLAQVKNNKTSLEQAQADLTHRLSQARLMERDLTKEVGFETSTLDRLTRELTQIQQEITGLELDQAASQMTDQEQLPVLTDQLTTAKAKQEEVEASLVRLRFELEDCEAALEDIAEQVAKASQQNDGLIRQQAKLENQLTNVNERLRNYNRLLTEDYRLSFGDARSAAQPLEDRETARQTLKQLERDIKALGPINLEAIAQHREVQERLDFLSGQKADLDHAKNLLLSTIKEMDDEVKERFQASFEAIRESFRLTFRQMFGGGSADLLLTEGDLLTAGVEISVQPPGKKIQSLNLMSGGEKALSALALLFAIIRVKTIPFVILDEVEAALDEANVKRFGDYLNRFDKSSQFIVVTHRRGTMAAADSIYGVTMQESGVSKIVSVKFTDAEKLMGD